MNPKPVSNQVVEQQLRWRYATKKFDPSRVIPADDWATLEDSMVLAPSSFGVQPWRFHVVTDSALKSRLREASWRQAQLTDASHVVAFAIKKNLGAADVDRFMARTMEVRGMPAASLDGYRKLIVNFLEVPGFDVDHWSAKQVYLALGQFMTAAAMLGIDTCPMEGIVPAQYDEILGLAADGYATVVACCAGYRHQDDKYATLPKIRYANADVIRRL